MGKMIRTNKDIACFNHQSGNILLNFNDFARF